FLYQITHESVVDCGDDCGVVATLVKLNEDNVAYECLRRTRVFDNNALFFVNKPHLEYCTGSGFTSAGGVLFTIINVIFGITNLIISIINLIPLVPDIEPLGT